LLYHPFAILDSHSARFTATSLWLTPATPPFLHPPSRTTPPFLHHPHAKVVCPCTLVSCSFCWPVRPVCDNPRFLRLSCFCLTSPLCPSFVTRPVSVQSLHFMCVLFFFAQFSCPGERPNTSQFPNPRRRFFSQKLVGNISFMIMYSSPEKCKTRITESAQDFRFISSGLSSCFKYNSHPFVPRTSSE